MSMHTQDKLRNHLLAISSCPEFEQRFQLSSRGVCRSNKQPKFDGEEYYLGSGSFAYVFCCADKEDPTQLYAVKVILGQKQEVAPEIEMLQNFYSLFANRIESMKIIGKYDFPDGTLIVTSLLNGRTVLDHVSYFSRFSKAAHQQAAESGYPFARKFTHDIGIMLYFLHMVKFIHRDISPGNIMYHEEAVPPCAATTSAPPNFYFTFIDFGHAALMTNLHDGKYGVVDCTGMGTLIAPENKASHSHSLDTKNLALPVAIVPLQHDQTIYDDRGDCWAFGVVLYQVLTNNTRIPSQSELEAGLHIFLTRHNHGGIGTECCYLREMLQETPSRAPCTPTSCADASTTHTHGSASDFSITSLDGTRTPQTPYTPTHPPCTCSDPFDLVWHLTRRNPDDRWTMRQALQHRWLGAIVEDSTHHLWVLSQEVAEILLHENHSLEEKEIAMKNIVNLRDSGVDMGLFDSDHWEPGDSGDAEENTLDPNADTHCSNTITKSTETIEWQRRRKNKGLSTQLYTQTFETDHEKSVFRDHMKAAAAGVKSHHPRSNGSPLDTHLHLHSHPHSHNHNHNHSYSHTHIHAPIPRTLSRHSSRDLSRRNSNDSLRELEEELEYFRDDAEYGFDYDKSGHSYSRSIHEQYDGHRESSPGGGKSMGKTSTPTPTGSFFRVTSFDHNSAIMTPQPLQRTHSNISSVSSRSTTSTKYRHCCYDAHSGGNAHTPIHSSSRQSDADALVHYAAREKLVARLEALRSLIWQHKANIEDKLLRIDAALKEGRKPLQELMVHASILWRREPLPENVKKILFVAGSKGIDSDVLCSVRKLQEMILEIRRVSRREEDESKDESDQNTGADQKPPSANRNRKKHAQKDGTVPLLIKLNNHKRLMENRIATKRYLQSELIALFGNTHSSIIASGSSCSAAHGVGLHLLGKIEKYLKSPKAKEVSPKVLEELARYISQLEELEMSLARLKLHAAMQNTESSRSQD